MDWVCSSESPTNSDLTVTTRNKRDFNDVIESTPRSISRLPIEIVLRIFHIVRDICAQTSSPSYELERLIGVCRTWRQLGLASPRLWTYIGNVSWPYLKVLTSRNSVFPFECVYTTETPPTITTPFMARALCEVICRVSNLTIISDESVLDKVLSDLISSPIYTATLRSLSFLFLLNLVLGRGEIMASKWGFW